MAVNSHHTRISCPKCNGRGHIDLPDRFVKVLAIVRSRKSISPEEVHKKLGDRDLGVTAIHQRLYGLRAFGLVKRERRGRLSFYSAVTR